MNMMLKPHLVLPCYPSFEIDVDSVEVEADVVSFTLESGCTHIECKMTATELKRSMFLESQFDPENGREVDYIQLEVNHETPVEVGNTNVDLVQGQMIVLTESQASKLNELLGYIAEEKTQEMTA